MSYIHEYRINKKGAECYRTRNWEQLKERYFKLAKKRPGVYTVQERSCQTDRYGIAIDVGGFIHWTSWREPYTLKED